MTDSIETLWSRWLARLREPTSRKVTGCLEHPYGEGMCCLGHACDELLPEEARCEVVDDTETGEIVIKWDDEDCVLPHTLAHDLDMETSGHFRTPIVLADYGLAHEDKAEKEAASIVVVNDRTDATLDQIADILERERDKGNLLSYSASCA